MPPSNVSSSRSGMTLVELLVVITIIGVLLALLLPAVQAARESARRSACLNSLKQLGLASLQYHDFNKKFPIGGRTPIFVTGRPMQGTNLWVELLPYFEQNNLHDQWDYEDNRNNVAGGIHATQAQVIEILVCPSDLLTERVWHATAQYTSYPAWSRGFYAMGSYGGSSGKRSVHIGPAPKFPTMSADGMFFLHSDVNLKDVSDGASHTLLFGERLHHDPEFDRRMAVLAPDVPGIDAFGHWGFVANHGGIMADITLHSAATINYQTPPNGNEGALVDRACSFGSGHAGGANFAFVDCSARFVAENLPLEQLQALSTRAGGEVVGGP